MMSRMTQESVVSERALVGRVNRALAREGTERVRLCPRRSRWFNDLGRYYSVDEQSNTIVGTHIELETFGREMGVLRDDECLADD